MATARAPAAIDSVRPPSASVHSAAELEPKEINRICALVLSAEQSAYMLYEQRRRIALATGQPAPPAPWLPELSGEQRKEISRIAADPQQLAYLEELQSRFIQATTPGQPPVPLADDYGYVVGAQVGDERVAFTRHFENETAGRGDPIIFQITERAF